MGVFKNFEFQASDLPQKEYLKVDFKRKAIVEATTMAIKFIDDDTGQVVIYMPAFDLSGYGNTYEKANEILKFHVGQFLNELFNMKEKDALRTLESLGWKTPWHSKKEFSKSFINIEGQLQNFNAKDESVERISFQLA